MGYQQCALAGQPRVAELPVHALGVARGKHELTLDKPSGLLHHDQLGRVAILDEQHAVRADGLCGMYLRARRRIVVPHHLLIGRNFCNPELVGEQDIPARQTHGVADLALAGMGVRPDHLPTAHDEHALFLGLAGVEEIVLRQTGPRQRRGSLGRLPGRLGKTGGEGHVGCLVLGAAHGQIH